MGKREQLYFINFSGRIGSVVTLAEDATPKAREANWGYRRVPRMVYRLLRPLLRREVKSFRVY